MRRVSVCKYIGALPSVARQDGCALTPCPKNKTGQLLQKAGPLRLLMPPLVLFHLGLLLQLAQVSIQLGALNALGQLRFQLVK